MSTKHVFHLLIQSLHTEQIDLRKCALISFGMLVMFVFVRRLAFTLSSAKKAHASAHLMNISKVLLPMYMMCILHIVLALLQ